MMIFVFQRYDHIDFNKKINFYISCILFVFPSLFLLVLVSSSQSRYLISICFCPPGFDFALSVLVAAGLVLLSPPDFPRAEPFPL
jgi:hypothetical protein